MCFLLNFLIVIQPAIAESKLTRDRMYIARENIARINIGSSLINQWNLASNELPSNAVQIYEQKYKNETEYEREIKELTPCEYREKILRENKNDLTAGQQAALLLLGTPSLVFLAEALSSANLELNLGTVGEFLFVKGKLLSGLGLLIYSKELGDGTLTAYYRTPEGFTDFLKKSEKEKEFYMQQDSKLYEMALKYYSYLKSINSLPLEDNDICSN